MFAIQQQLSPLLLTLAVPVGHSNRLHLALGRGAVSSDGTGEFLAWAVSLPVLAAGLPIRDDQRESEGFRPYRQIVGFEVCPAESGGAP